jgi:hypothetical protein
MKSPKSMLTRADRSRCDRRSGRAVRVTLAAALILIAARAGASTLRTAATFAEDGNVLLCEAVNWDEKARAIEVRIVITNDGSEAASATCPATAPRTSCFATETVSVPILSSGFFACEIEVKGSKSRLRGVLENTATGRSVEAR